ncbi:MAG TPA: hypothetical protein PKA31_03235 [Candidatus Moranbacteria bacterium]|nr:hypothetical protein [Candidatus Moranbacteria bacterium]
MTDFIKKQKIALAIVAYILLIAAVVCFVVLPLLEEGRHIREEIERETALQEGRQQRLGEVPKLREQHAKIETGREELDVLLVRDDAVKLISVLEGLAEKEGVNIEIAVDESLAKPKATARAKQDDSKDKEKKEALIDGLPSQDYVQFSVTLNGPYGAVVNFIERVEVMPYYADILSLAFKTREEKEERPSGNPLVGSGAPNAKEEQAPSGNVEATVVLAVYLQSK